MENTDMWVNVKHICMREVFITDSITRVGDFFISVVLLHIHMDTEQG